MDKQTRRVVALILLLIVAGAALRGYLPVTARGLHGEPGSKAALTFVVAGLAGTMALLAVAIIARLRDPVATAPNTGDLSDMLGTGRGRPSWRVVLIGLAVIAAWLLIAMLLARIWAPPQAASPAPNPAPGAAAPATPHAAPPRQHNESGDMLAILLLATIPMMLLIVTGTVIMSRRRRQAITPGVIADHRAESPASPTRSESLARAAERGLAEMTDLSREPREAIIACYAAMEAELANVPGAAPQDFDTPTEVLARAVDHHALQAGNAVRLVDLFAEARFSPHVMNESHRDAAMRVLRLVLDELETRRAA